MRIAVAKVLDKRYPTKKVELKRRNLETYSTQYLHSIKGKIAFV